MNDYAEEWQELDEKVLLVQLLAEQQRTNTLIEQLLGGDTTPSKDEATPMYRCELCDKEVKEEDRQRHAEGQHKTPPGAWDSVFERVE